MSGQAVEVRTSSPPSDRLSTPALNERLSRALTLARLPELERNRLEARSDGSGDALLAAGSPEALALRQAHAALLFYRRQIASRIRILRRDPERLSRSPSHGPHFAELAALCEAHRRWRRRLHQLLRTIERRELSQN